MTAVELLAGSPAAFGLDCRPFLSADECDEVIRAVEAGGGWSSAGIYRGDGDRSGSAVDPDERSVAATPLPSSVPGGHGPLHVLDRLVAALVAVNDEVFRFRLAGIPSWDLPSVLRYEGDHADHFREHSDAGAFAPTRRLTFTVQLSAPDAYDGGDLVVSSLNTSAPRDRGALVTFASTHLHHVTPVLRGRRYAVVGWVHGSAAR